jgi:hypothetical protein
MASHRVAIQTVYILILFASLSLASLSAAQAIPVIRRVKPLVAGSSAGSSAAAGEPIRVSLGNWSQLAKVGPGHFTEFFGNTAAVSGDTVVVGTWPVDADRRTGYIFLKTANDWDTRPAASLGHPRRMGVSCHSPSTATLS